MVERWRDPEVIEAWRNHARLLDGVLRRWRRNWRARGERATPTTGGRGVRPTEPVKAYPPPPLPHKEGR